MLSEKIIAVKEFKDYVSSKRFLLIFAVLLLMSVASIIAGVASYNSQLAYYNQQLSSAASNVPLPLMYQPVMPSMMLVFESFSGIFVNVGWLLALVVGFDLVSKEKETGSLKLLLARPTFRDSIINGKIIGSTAVLVLALAATFLVTIALLLFLGIVPTVGDLINIVFFFVVLVLFSLAFLAVAIAASTIAKNSTMAMLLAIGVVVFSFLVPSFSSTIAGIILGPAPPATVPVTNTTHPVGAQAQSSNPHAVHVPNSSDELDVVTINGVKMGDNPAYRDYEHLQSSITGVVNLLSPTYDLTSISSVVTHPVTIDVGPNGYIVGRDEHPLFMILPQIISLLLITIMGFALAYVGFLRMDVR